MHNHQTEHHAAKSSTKKVLLIATMLTLLFAGVEAITGWWSNSLTLLSDAGHMLSDSSSLLMAALAAWIASRPPSSKHTYGMGRAEVISAWISSLFMLIIIAAVTWEAIERFNNPSSIAGVPVMVVGSIGLVINLLIALILSKGEKNLNTRAAILHVMSDALGSVAALLSGIVIYFTNWTLIDPILSIFICLLILLSTIRLLRESMLVLMEAVPKHINIREVTQAVCKIEHVFGVHDLHIWTLTSGMVLLTAHVEIQDKDLSKWDPIIENISKMLITRFCIKHITLQPELVDKKSKNTKCKTGNCC